MKKHIKEGVCPKCGTKLYRRHTKKPTKCNKCGFLIEKPKEVFKPRNGIY
jgi:uncharacterized protein (DUF983 family)